MSGDLDNNEIEISVQDTPQMPSLEIPGMQGNVGMVSIVYFGKGLTKEKEKMTVKIIRISYSEESYNLMDDDQVLKVCKICR